MRALLVLVVVGGCSDDHGSSGPYVAVDHLVEGYQAAICSHLVTCHEMPDQETCLDSTVGTFTIDPNLVSEVLAGVLRYNGSLVAKCFATLADSSCNSGALAYRVSVNECVATAFTGTLAMGATCSSDLECASNDCSGCSGELTCCPDGTCVGMPKSSVPPGLGASCSLDQYGVDPCVVGQYCDDVCTAVKPLGAPCTSTNQCGDGLECDTQTTNRCAVPPLRDEPCTANGYCGEEGTYCAPGEDICRAVGLVGDPCTAGHACSNYLYCNTTTQLCELYPRTGESCASQQRCNDLGTYCDIASETCITRVTDGKPCDASYRCLSLFCDMATMRCAEPALCPQ